ncbi:transcriptional regulator [Saprospira grandis DSM 2844]|uniref:Transcriptional regulator n=1 Tax=Saprospira grandis DSM 2844 TaxID=694433 RepID=J0PA91_9BACT|nr:LysR family transcriptional regulator [Saprospira grandis]EJF54522.1 transcriptional regulator [Saprospira grandis DSM 2844]
MNLQFVKYFVLLAESKSFTLAAKRAYVVQSTFSSGIKKLEEQLNCLLFFRDKRNVFLTTEGQELLPKAKKLLANWEEMQTFKEKTSRQVLKLGLSPDLDFTAILPLIKQFHKRYPTYEVQLVEKSCAMELLETLKKNEIHALFSKTALSLEHVQQELIREDPLGLAVPLNHPFAQLPQVDVRLLDQSNFIERSNCSKRDEILDFFQSHQIKINTVFKAKGDEMARALVSAGLGISLIPVLEKKPKSYHIIPLKAANFKRKIFLQWAKDNLASPLKYFLEELQFFQDQLALV